MFKGQKLKLKRSIFLREASHGLEEADAGETVPKGLVVEIVGPSKVPGHWVVLIRGKYARVKAESL